MIQRTPNKYEKDGKTYYQCDIRNARNLEEIYDARRSWTKGVFSYTTLLEKSTIEKYLTGDYLIAVEGLEEINEEDLAKLI